MSKCANQKLKILCLLKIMTSETCRSSPVSVAQLIERLADFGVTAERKSIYDDLAALRDFGLDIRKTPDRAVKYYVASRPLPLSDMKLIAEAVQSSPLITRRRSGALIKKMATVLPVAEAGQLPRCTEYPERIKSMSESAYPALEIIRQATAGHRRVSFRYSAPTPAGSAAPDGGGIYSVCPLSLKYDGKFYYFAAMNGDTERIFRVDRMSAVRIGAEYQPARRTSAKKAADTAVEITLECADEICGDLYDFFGNDTPTEPGEGKFTARVRVTPDAAFYGFVLSHGGAVRILAPADICERAVALAGAALAANSDK